MPEASTEKHPASAPVEAPNSHRKALQLIEEVTANADQVQHRVLSKILRQNMGAEYRHRHSLGSVPDPYAFNWFVPMVTYDDLQQDIHRIAQGDTSPSLCYRPISEFLTGSGTSGGERKLMPTIQDELDHRSLLYGLLRKYTVN